MAISTEGLLWNGPYNFRSRNQIQLPAEPGFYAFTDSGHLRPGSVLNVGATLSLRSRVPQYDFSTLGNQYRPDARHAGMIHIREWQRNPGKQLFVWWALFPPLKKEKELVSAFVRRFNDKLTNEVTATWGI